MNKLDIENLELNKTQQNILKKRLENSNFKVANSNLETNVLKSEGLKHIQDLKNDSIKLARRIQREASKQKLKDICSHKIFMCVMVMVSTLLSLEGLKITDNR